MSPRGILVASKDDDKVYYFLDPVGQGKQDGAIVSADGSVEFIDFGSYMLSEPFLSEYKYSDFHKFLWGRHEGEDLDRWQRIFIYKTQPVSQEMLEGVKIETSISPKIKSKHYFDNRAMEFKSLNSSNQMESMSGVAVSRKLFKPVRTIGKQLFNESSVDWRSSWADEGESANG